MATPIRRCGRFPLTAGPEGRVVRPTQAVAPRGSAAGSGSASGSAATVTQRGFRTWRDRLHRRGRWRDHRHGVSCTPGRRSSARGPGAAADESAVERRSPGRRRLRDGLRRDGLRRVGSVDVGSVDVGSVDLGSGVGSGGFVATAGSRFSRAATFSPASAPAERARSSRADETAVTRFADTSEPARRSAGIPNWAGSVAPMSFVAGSIQQSSSDCSPKRRPPSAGPPPTEVATTPTSCPDSTTSPRWTCTLLGANRR